MCEKEIKNNIKDKLLNIQNQVKLSRELKFFLKKNSLSC
jgi:hypothetical protein